MLHNRCFFEHKLTGIKISKMGMANDMRFFIHSTHGFLTAVLVEKMGAL
jgi:hypothetical protein